VAALFRSPSVIGKTVVLNGRSHTMVGVVPEGFEFWQRDVEAWGPHEWKTREILPLERTGGAAA